VYIQLLEFHTQRGYLYVALGFDSCGAHVVAVTAAVVIMEKNCHNDRAYMRARVISMQEESASARTRQPSMIMDWSHIISNKPKTATFWLASLIKFLKQGAWLSMAALPIGPLPP